MKRIKKEPDGSYVIPVDLNWSDLVTTIYALEELGVNTGKYNTALQKLKMHLKKVESRRQPKEERDNETT